jgi:hypothetical protein
MLLHVDTVREVGPRHDRDALLARALCRSVTNAKLCPTLCVLQAPSVRSLSKRAPLCVLLGCLFSSRSNDRALGQDADRCSALHALWTGRVFP